MPRAACRVPRAACRVPRAACRVPRAACRVPRAACPTVEGVTFERDGVPVEAFLADGALATNPLAAADYAALRAACRESRPSLESPSNATASPSKRSWPTAPLTTNPFNHQPL
ncbi:hypothetical protein GCM10027269_18240 [Kribbella endophytica]